MASFIEIVDGLSIDKNLIVSVGRVGDKKIVIQTEHREFEVNGNYKSFIEFLNKEEEENAKARKFTDQYFGG